MHARAATSWGFPSAALLGARRGLGLANQSGDACTSDGNKENPGKVDKPNSVCSARGGRGNHFSCPELAPGIMRPTRGSAEAGHFVPTTEWPGCPPTRSCSQQGLPCVTHYCVTGGLLHHRFTLTRHRLSYPEVFGALPAVDVGCLFSVALSVSAGYRRRNPCFCGVLSPAEFGLSSP